MEAIDVTSLAWSAQESPFYDYTHSVGPSIKLIIGIKYRLIIISLDCWRDLGSLDLPPISTWAGAYGLYISCICITLIHKFIAIVVPVLPALNYSRATCTYFLLQCSLHYSCAPCSYVFQCSLNLFIHQTIVNYSNLDCTHLGQTCSLPIRPSPGLLCVISINLGFQFPLSFRYH